jgi:hypothetical protein
MDNVSNCDTTAEHLSQEISKFQGASACLRCFPHTVNLIAKAFISFFFRQPKKRVQKASAGTKRTQRGREVEEEVIPLEDLETLWTDQDELEREVAPADASADDEVHDEIDEAKAVHDQETVSNLWDQAIKDCQELHNIVIPMHSEQEALDLLPKVRRIDLIALVYYSQLIDYI